jgi:hypothetical protein
MTHQLLSIQRLSGSGVGPNPYPGSFLALTWACSVFQFSAFCIRWLGIRTVGRETVGACRERIGEVEVERGIELEGGKQWETCSKDS